MYKVLINRKLKDMCDVTFIQTLHCTPVNAERTDAAPQGPFPQIIGQDSEVLEEGWEPGKPESAADADMLPPVVQLPAPLTPLRVMHVLGADDEPVVEVK